MSPRAEPLFYGQTLRDVLLRRQRDALQEVESLDPDRMLGMIPGDLVDHLVEKYRCAELTLDEAAVEAEVLDTRRDVRHEPGRDVWGAGPVYVPATVVEFHVPYSGDVELLRSQASHYSMNAPRGVVTDSEIVVQVDASGQDADSARSAFSSVHARIKEHISWANADAVKHNEELRQAVSARVATRREKLLRDRGLADSLGFPIRARKGKRISSGEPLRRRSIDAPLPPSSSRGSYRPEPALADRDYEDILRVITNMVAVMERSPHAFATMGEEDLRQHFLVQLNGRYEGDATGETFNFEGKTDILVRRDGANVFIGECKIWRGPKEFASAIDQLLDYVTWRDTKTALLVFNRNRSMTAVLEKVQKTLEEHPHFKRFEPYASETGFRCRIAHKNDPAREIILTVLVFDVPDGASGEEDSSS
jgi:hypothetical protein